jgi:hypothetical protein
MAHWKAAHLDASKA